MLCKFIIVIITSLQSDYAEYVLHLDFLLFAERNTSLLVKVLTPHTAATKDGARKGLPNVKTPVRTHHSLLEPLMPYRSAHPSHLTSPPMEHPHDTRRTAIYDRSRHPLRRQIWE